MAKNGIVTQYDDAGFPANAASTTPITAAGTVTVKSAPGRLLKVVVTASATGTLTFYDNSSTGSGTILLVVPASPTVGTVYDVNLPAVNGVTVVAAATPSSVVVGYA